MLTLTPQERHKFADYLEQEAFSDDGIAKRLGADALTTGQKHYRMQAAMKMGVSKWLRSIEDMSIGG